VSPSGLATCNNKKKKEKRIKATHRRTAIAFKDLNDDRKKNNREWAGAPGCIQQKNRNDC
jgi:hypothetical protein